MTEREWLAERFEQHRDHLRGVAYRMLGSLAEAEDAVQDAWLRVSRADRSEVENLGGWLTTVTARICLDLLRARRARREESLDDGAAEPVATGDAGADPAMEAELADSVGLAMMVVLETLAPAERLAFVLHDMFDLPFDEIAGIVGRSPTAARQLASRARRRVRGGAPRTDRDLDRQREVVEAYLAAARGGSFEALLTVLDPEVVLRTDAAASPSGAPLELRGAAAVGRGAIAAARGARFARLALVDGAVGLIVAPGGRLRLALAFTIAEGRVAEIDVIAEPERLRELELAVVPDRP